MSAAAGQDAGLVGGDDDVKVNECAFPRLSPSDCDFFISLLLLLVLRVLLESIEINSQGFKQMHVVAS